MPSVPNESWLMIWSKPKRAVRQDTRQVLAEQAVREERRADDRERDAHDAPCRLEHEDDQHDADDEVRRRQVARPLDEVRLEDPLVERRWRRPRAPSSQPTHAPRFRAASTSGNITNVSSSRKLTCSARITTLDSGANAAVYTWYVENATRDGEDHALGARGSRGRANSHRIEIGGRDVLGHETPFASCRDDGSARGAVTRRACRGGRYLMMPFSL